jgi:competence protein ComEC
VAGGWPAPRAADAAADANRPARIVFVDVGQGDAVVMRLGSTVVVSDAGEFHLDRVEDALRALGRTRTIDVVVLSHPHDDHVRNAIGLLERGWRFRSVLLTESGHWRGTATNRELMGLLAEAEVPLRFLTAGDTFTWGGATVDILNPPAGRFDGGSNQAANVSAAYLLEVNGVTALFTGDVEPNVSKELALDLRARLDGPVDIFLATHHGSKHGSTQELLDVIRPRWAVVSAGAGNRFGHPAADALARLEASGASLWCTDTNGSTTARISRTGRLTWRSSRQRAPFWSGRDSVRNGRCAAP